jgi:hypothetical protein
LATKCSVARYEQSSYHIVAEQGNWSSKRAELTTHAPSHLDLRHQQCILCQILSAHPLYRWTQEPDIIDEERAGFSLGITLKRIEVIADDEDEIIEAARRMSQNYDFVVTSGGIGPTVGLRWRAFFFKCVC